MVILRHVCELQNSKYVARTGVQLKAKKRLIWASSELCSLLMRVLVALKHMPDKCQNDV